MVHHFNVYSKRNKTNNIERTKYEKVFLFIIKHQLYADALRMWQLRRY